MAWRFNQAGHFFDPGEDLVVYFNPESGDTHLISEFAAYLLHAMPDHPVEYGELIELIRPDLDPEYATELLAEIPTIFEELVNLDIVKHT